MDRRDLFYRQKVKDTELDEVFDLAEQGDWSQSTDNALIGIHVGETVTQQGVPDLTVQVAAGVATDKLGRRLAIPGPQNLNCAIDENSLTTQVTTIGFEKFLSVFLRFERAESDPRTDGNGMTIQYVQAESFTLRIVQGIEAAAPAPRPALDPQDILLGDIRLVFGQTQIFTADVLSSRREDYFRLSTATLNIVAGDPGEAISQLATDISAATGTSTIGGAAIDLSDLVGFGATAPVVAAGPLDGQLLEFAQNVGPVGTWSFKAGEIPGINAGVNWTVNDNGNASTSTDGENIQFFLGFLTHANTLGGTFKIFNIRAYVLDTDASNVIGIELRSVSVTTGAASSSEIALVQSNGSGAVQTLTLASGAGIDLSIGSALYIDVSTDGGGASNRSLFGIQIDLGYEQ